MLLVKDAFPSHPRSASETPTPQGALDGWARGEVGRGSWGGGLVAVAQWGIVVSTDHCLGVLVIRITSCFSDLSGIRWITL